MSRLVSRRAAILGGIASTAKPFGGRSAAPGLNDIAKSSGIRFGSASDIAVNAAPSRYAGVLAPAWEDPNIAFAEGNNMVLTGGNLLWHGSLPAAFAQMAPGAAAQSMAASHIARMVGHYAGRMFSWNVVNEAIDPRSGNGDGLRQSLLREKLGPDFIAAAFRSARAADSKAPGSHAVIRLEPSDETRDSHIQRRGRHIPRQRRDAVD